MTWFRVDDGFAFHAKALRAGNAALGLWVRAGAWSSQHLTDGAIPAEVAATLGTPAQVKRLVEAGLWVATDHGYQFHDWGEMNPMGNEVRDRRKRNAAKNRAHRERQSVTTQLQQSALHSETCFSDEKSGRPDAARFGERSTSGAPVTGVVTGHYPVSDRGSDRQPDPVTEQAPTASAVGAGRIRPATRRNVTKRDEDGLFPPPPLTLTQRSKMITDAYAAAEPMCKWPAVNGVVIKALRVERWSDDEIRAALLRLAADNISVTVDSLRSELNGLNAPRNGNGAARISPADKIRNTMTAAAIAQQAMEAREARNREGIG